MEERGTPQSFSFLLFNVIGAVYIIIPRDLLEGTYTQ